MTTTTKAESIKSTEVKPKVGDTVRLEWYIMGIFAGLREFKLEELHYCLGYYGEGPKTPCNFTPLSELWSPAPGAKHEYRPNYGPYYSDYVQTFEIIAK
ncbi:MAG: hypothetical protein GY928_36545 [Colwellia sp.]|nr:hypothetical protein [Colwellia sp.]